MIYSETAHHALHMVHRWGVTRRHGGTLISRRVPFLSRRWVVLVDGERIDGQDCALWTLTALETAGLIVWATGHDHDDIAELTAPDGYAALTAWDAAVFAVEDSEVPA